MTKATYICHTCGKKFESTQHAKYCSIACKRAVQNRKRAIFQCVYCGAQFEGNKNQKPRFCSMACVAKCRKEVLDNPDSTLAKYIDAHPRKSETYRRVCTVCGNYFETKSPSNVNRCCQDCAKDYGKRWYKELKETQQKGYIPESALDCMLELKGIDPQMLQSQADEAKAQTTVPNITREENNARRRMLRRKKAALGLSEKQSSGPKTEARIKLLKSRGSRCELCGWQMDSDALQVHHINMDRSDNSDGNLSVICANCHAIIHMRMKRNWTEARKDTAEYAKLEFDRLKAELKSRNKAGKPCEGRSEPKAGSNAGQGQRIPAGPEKDISRHEAATGGQPEKLC